MRELIRCDIFTNIVVLGLVGLFYGLVGTTIDLSIQGLKLSYNFNLLIIGFSNLIGYFTASI